MLVTQSQRRLLFVLGLAWAVMGYEIAPTSRFTKTSIHRIELHALYLGLNG